MSLLSEVRWVRVLGAGVAATIAFFVLIVLVSTVPTVVLAVLGTPDQTSIEQIINPVETWGTPVLTVLSTVFAAAWVARGAEAGTAAVHGLLVGILVALIGPALGSLGPPSPALAVVTVATGLLGGWLGGRGRSVDPHREGR